jgi:hypothetical protein
MASGFSRFPDLGSSEAERRQDGHTGLAMPVTLSGFAYGTSRRSSDISRNLTKRQGSPGLPVVVRGKNHSSSGGSAIRGSDQFGCGSTVNGWGDTGHGLGVAPSLEPASVALVPLELAPAAALEPPVPAWPVAD